MSLTFVIEWYLGVRLGSGSMSLWKEDLYLQDYEFRQCRKAVWRVVAICVEAASAQVVAIVAGQIH
jgi:hypothetical protein